MGMPEDENYDTNLKRMHSSIPDAIKEQTAVDLMEEGQNALDQYGLPKLTVIYHLLPGDDRRLGSMCTTQELMDEFGVSRKTAAGKIQDLEDSGILHRRPTRSHTVCIHKQHWSAIEDASFSDQVRRHEPLQIPDDIRPAYTRPSQQDPADTESDPTSSVVELADLSEGLPSLPIGIGVVCTVLGLSPAGPSSVLAVGLLITTLLALVECAKLPNHSPRETLDLLQSEEVQFVGA